MTSKVARRYAKAIFDYLKDSADGPQVADELEAFGRLIEKNREARIVLVFGLVPVEKRQQVVADLALHMKMSDGTRRALTVLTSAGRLSELTAISERLRALISAKSNIVLIDVKSAVDMDNGMKTKIENKFEKVLNTKVEARYSVDANLLAGLKVTASGRTFDGSVSGMLGQLQEQFAQGEMQ